MNRRDLTRLMCMAAVALTAFGTRSAAGPAAAQAPTELRDVLEAAGRELTTTFGRGDAAGMADAYTRDALMIPANSDFITGRAAIQAFWQSALDLGAKAFLTETMEVKRSGRHRLPSR